MFFGLVIPMWLTEGLKEYFGKVKPFDPEDIRRKLITEQEGVETIYSNLKETDLSFTITDIIIN
jgi:hypothetical protein